MCKQNVWVKTDECKRSAMWEWIIHNVCCSGWIKNLYLQKYRKLLSKNNLRKNEYVYLKGNVCLFKRWRHGTEETRPIFKYHLETTYSPSFSYKDFQPHIQMHNVWESVHNLILKDSCHCTLIISRLSDRRGVSQFLTKMSYMYHGNRSVNIADVSKWRTCTRLSF